MKKILSVTTIALLLSSSVINTDFIYAKSSGFKSFHSSEKQKVQYVSYKVKKGDTLYSIAKKYHTSVAQIQKDNHLKSTKVRVNQVLSIRFVTVLSTVSSPVFDNLLTATRYNSYSYTVNGNSEAYATVYLQFTDGKGKSLSFVTRANSKGKFSIKANLISLSDGQIKLSGYQKTTKHGTSTKSETTFLKDTIGPSVSFKVSDISSENQSSFEVSGTTESKSKIEISVIDKSMKTIKKIVTADTTGSFTGNFDVRSLKDGKITIKAISFDQYGNSLTSSTSVTKLITVTTPPPVVDKTVYELDSTARTKWGIFNNGTHPVETTKGINDALVWASQNGFKTVKVQAGNYLIAKGTKEDDRSARITMVSNMTLELDKNAVFQKEANGFKGYSVVYFGPGVQNSTLKGGTLIGDREKHDFSAGGTQEWGHGVLFAGGDNLTVDGVKIQKMNGDGIYIGMSPVGAAWEAKYGGTSKSTIEAGGVDDNGNLTDASGKIRNIGFLDWRGEKNEKYRMINVWGTIGITSSYFDVYFYDQDKNFLKKETGIMRKDYIKAPAEASYYRIVFSAPSVNGVYALMYPVDVSNNVVIKNSDIGFNRRQGITAGGENVQILNNYIHDTKGTAPQSGIDIEPGFQTAKNHVIKGNMFENNVIQMVVSQGNGLLVQDNKFVINKNVGGAGVGFHVHSSYKNVQILNNTFEGRGLSLENSNTIMSGNSFNNANAQLGGYLHTFSKGNFSNGKLVVGGSATVTDSNFNSGGGLTVNGNIQAKNLHLTGTTSIPVIFEGFASKDSTYDNITVINGTTASTSIPSGTYTNSSFTYNGTGTSGLGIQYGEHIVMDGVSFKNVTLTMHSIKHGATATIKNSTFTYDGEMKQAAVNAGDGQSLILLNNKFFAKNATNTNIPIVVFGKELDMYVAEGVVDGNEFHVRPFIKAVDTAPAGSDKPAFIIKNNTIYNGVLNLFAKDVNENNQFLKE